jgi:putative N6-adenine-specific DNA methylase
MPTLFLPCAGGTEDLLAEEVKRLTGSNTEAVRGGVYVPGDAHTVLLLNLECRLAQRVLWPVAWGPYRDENDLYDLGRRVLWQEWITPQHTLRVDANAWRSPLKSLNFAALRVKDAVCDQLRELTGERPSVDTHRPDLSLVLYCGPEEASLYVDTSGEALFKRGWRDERGGGLKGEAPLKETLAAAMLAAAGWWGRPEDGPLLDPCCGAGTIAIEAAQMACGIAPGGQRHFAFERLLKFSHMEQAWLDLKAAAEARVHAPHVPIFAGDVAFRMTDFAQRNAERAGVGQAIQFKTMDALQRPAPTPTGTMMFNPPYGERIAAKGQGSQAARQGFEGGGSSNEFFNGLSSHWKRHYAGWSAWLLSPDMKLPTLMRLKESRRIPMWNGPIECRLFRFDMVAGSNKDKP